MIVELSCTITLEEQYRNRDSEDDGHYGSCQIYKDIDFRGTWEFESYPNLDAYAFSVYGYDNIDLLLDRMGFNPSEHFEIDYSSVDLEIWGEYSEWMKQAKNLHDGRWYDNPREALEKMSSWDESSIEKEHIDLIMKLEDKVE